MNYVKFNIDNSQVVSLFDTISSKTPICVEMFVSTAVDENNRYVGIPWLWGVQIHEIMVWGRTVESLVSALSNISACGCNVVYSFDLVYLMYFLRPYFYLTDDSMKGHTSELYSFGITCGDRKLTFKSLCSISGSNTIDEFVGNKYPKIDRRVLTHETRITYEEYSRMWNILFHEEKYLVSLLKIFGSPERIPRALSSMIKKELQNSCFGDKARPYYQKQLGYFERGKKTDMMPLPILDVEHFNFLNTAFQGGYVGFNDNYIDKTMYNVMSYDFTSSYIACMLAYKYPVEWRGYIYNPTLEQAISIFNQGYLGIMQVVFTNIKSTHPCRPIKLGMFRDDLDLSKGEKCVEYSSDDTELDESNGLVYSSSLLVDITNVDLMYLSWFYTWDSIDIQFIDTYYSNYLPKSYTDTVLSLFKDKSVNKGNPDKFMESVTKKKVNITYGLMVSGFWTVGYRMNNGSFEKIHYDLEDLINRYNNFQDRFSLRVSAYQWGIFCTAYARYNLFMIIKYLGDSWIYSDTDSVYFTFNEVALRKIEKYNRYITDLLLKSPSVESIDDIRVKSQFVDKEYNLGHMILDADCKRFKFLKLKTYLREERDGSYKLVVAGCSNFNKEFFKTVEPFEWFTMEGGHVVPAEYCDSYNENYTFEKYRGVVVDCYGRRREVNLKGGCCKVYTDFKLKPSGIRYLLGVLL